MTQHLQAVVFDMDGVIAETEGEGHRVAFNKTFADMGIQVEWSYETYGELLKISGGKERMRHFFLQQPGFIPEEKMDEIIADMHKRKTTIFQDLIQSGGIPLRPGVQSFIQSLLDRDIKIALATTSNEKAANTLLATLLGMETHARFSAILAGDIVSKKKPDPEIYNLAARRLNIDPRKSFVIEDTENGLKAGLAAGFHVCVTKSAYTRHEDFSGAAFVVDSIVEGSITVEKLVSYIQEHTT